MNVKKIFTGTILFLVIFLSNSTLCSGQSKEYFDAIKYYHANDTTEARNLFLVEVTNNPDNDAAYFYLALISSRDKKNNEETEKYFKKALEKDPKNFWYKYYMALYYADTDRLELTTVMLEELMINFPKKSDLYFDAINAYLSQNDIIKALNTLEKIETITGKTEIIALTKMDLLFKQNKENDAYAFLEEYYKGCKTPKIATMLGDYYAKLFNDTTSLKYYDEAIEMSPGYTPAYYGKAHIHRALRQYDKYFINIRPFIKDIKVDPKMKGEYLQELLSSQQFVTAFIPQIDSLVLDAHNAHPTDSTINSILGVYYYQTERGTLALNILKKNMEIYPDSYNAGFQYLLFLYYSQLWKEIIPVADTILNRFPENLDVIQLKAISQWQNQDIQGSIYSYKQLTTIAPKDSAICVFANSALGDLYYQQGMGKKAYNFYKKALKANPNYAPVLNNYAYYLSTEGKNLKKALAMSKKTVEQEPDNPTYLDTYAWILHLTGHSLEAKAFFKHAMIYGGKKSAVIIDHYADVLYTLKEYDLAFIYWDQAKALDNSLGIDEKIKLKKNLLQK